MNDDSDASGESVLIEVAAALRSLRGVYDGEPIDELDHALQSAGRAMDDGADDELILAAALHDIARSPALGFPGDCAHDREARDWLTPRFGERVGWLAGAHVAAKRYLVATESGYAATLSGQSVATLDKQGGAVVDAEFTGHPSWPDAVRLRRWDDAAKVPGAQAPSVDDVIAVARRVRLAVTPTP
ncbi:putative HD phosphohydrolase [Rhodococcus wratislaviensis]|uniref:Predicted HD phosphohydrolase n=1 Tax=Rhodococcus wratislaviensis TaxID=44752 RepID=A0AB38FA38_RHOWR|nr:HD family phosphohydrolase [Rhodococcus wratislaviensis]REE71810.1 putative HD phosphohydrolase [Rhodococcus wratislaviensis]SPZ38378.1 Predicted HD phosphohydrolase [Rhodococcus wratislaviensis]